MAEVPGSHLLLKQWRCPSVLLRSAHEMPRHCDLQERSSLVLAMRQYAISLWADLISI